MTKTLSTALFSLLALAAVGCASPTEEPATLSDPPTDEAAPAPADEKTNVDVKPEVKDELKPQGSYKVF